MEHQRSVVVSNFSYPYPCTYTYTYYLAFTHTQIHVHSHTSSGTLYFWFWDWVDSNCPQVLSSINCQACEPYALTFCAAEANMCFDENGETEEGNPYCPYTVCRRDVLKYTRTRIL
ncbi:hypothetical protein EON63_01110 [archaeon]|nr:MAG: hypothetical protein EON63_01110 [archaeon]